MGRDVEVERLQMEKWRQTRPAGVSEGNIQFRQNRHTYLVLGLKVLHPIRTADLAARVRFLRPAALSFGATVLRRLIRKE